MVVSVTTLSAVWMRFAICTDVVTTLSATVSSSAVVIPIDSASSLEAANSPELSVLSVANAQGSMLVSSSGVTVSGKPNATMTA